MAAKKRKVKKDEQGRLANDHTGKVAWAILGCLMFLSVILIRVHQISIAGPYIIPAIETYGFFIDVFVFYKWISLCLGISIIAVLLISRLLLNQEQVKSSTLNIPLAILATLVILSTLHADYVNIALFGIVDIFMGAAQFLACLLLCWLVINLPSNFQRFHYLSIALYLMVGTELVICIGSFYGVLWHQVPIIGDFIAHEVSEEAQFSGSIISTLSNPNYASGLFGALAAFFLSLAALLNNRRQVIWSSIMAAACMLIVSTQLSTSGFVAFLAGLIIAFCLWLIYKRGSVYSLIAILACVATITAGIWLLNIHNSKVADSSIGWFQNAGKMLAMEDSIKSDSANSSVFSDDLEANVDDKFTINTGATSTIDSYRLYIARETWKLVQLKPLLGYGMDTMVYYYPITSRETIETFGADQYLTKPHNMYLQIAFGAGIPALLCFLCIIGIFLWTGFKKALDSYKTGQQMDPWLAASMVFVISFCIQGLVNDITLGPAVIFFALIGIGHTHCFESRNLTMVYNETSIKAAKARK